MTKPISTLDEAIEFIENYDGSAEDFQLAISESLQDLVGMNMAIITDKVLAKGFAPAGFDQRDGFRLYKYKVLE